MVASRTADRVAFFRNSPNAHHLINSSGTSAVRLEVGTARNRRSTTRTPMRPYKSLPSSLKGARPAQNTMISPAGRV